MKISSNRDLTCRWGKNNADLPYKVNLARNTWNQTRSFGTVVDRFAGSRIVLKTNSDRDKTAAEIGR
ncbi:MAG: hypothetical protein DMG93_21320 [Acidobacteria bacterium]|nr:MAG: hypothetical protein DMG93_21320 [Acidobacteriota bacterium]